MGLDMYLTKRHYVKNWNHEPERKHKITVKLNGKLRKDINFDNIGYLIEEVMYWRKSNHIHQWFVENVQEGNDDCEKYYVEKDQLKELLVTINDVLEDHNKASDLLPTQSGFFFGSTEYDSYYFDELEDTKKALEREIKLDHDYNTSYFYQPSW